MSFPNASVNTANLDSATDDPSLARADLLDAVQKLNTIIEGGGSASGVALLNASNQIPTGKLPQSISYQGGNQIINPSTGIVNIQDVLRLTALQKSDILDISTATLQIGDLAIASNGNTGTYTVALCVFSGVEWLKISTTTRLT
jgi:hypothetical protein